MQSPSQPQNHIPLPKARIKGEEVSLDFETEEVGHAFYLDGTLYAPAPEEDKAYEIDPENPHFEVLKDNGKAYSEYLGTDILGEDIDLF